MRAAAAHTRARATSEDGDAIVLVILALRCEPQSPLKFNGIVGRDPERSWTKADGEKVSLFDLFVNVPFAHAPVLRQIGSGHERFVVRGKIANADWRVVF